MSQYIDKYIIAGLIDCHGNVHWEDIDDIPIADVRENVRGKWLRPSNSLWKIADCSVCGITSVEAENFCPNCGADMRGGGA